MCVSTALGPKKLRVKLSSVMRLRTPLSSNCVPMSIGIAVESHRLSFAVAVAAASQPMQSIEGIGDGLAVDIGLGSRVALSGLKM